MNLLVILLLSPAVICAQQRLRKSTNPNDEPFLPIHPDYPYSPKLMKRGLEHQQPQQQQQQQLLQQQIQPQTLGQLTPELYAPKVDGRDAYSSSYGQSPYYSNYDSLSKLATAASSTPNALTNSPYLQSALSSFNANPYSLLGAYGGGSPYGSGAANLGAAAGAAAAASNFAASPGFGVGPGASPFGGAGASPFGGAGASPFGGAGASPFGGAGASPFAGAGASPYGAAGASPYGAAGSYYNNYYQPPYYYPNYYGQPPYPPPPPGYPGGPHKHPYDDDDDDDEDEKRREKSNKKSGHHKNRLRHSDRDNQYVDGANYIISSAKDLDGESSTHRAPAHYNQIEDSDVHPRTANLPKATYRLIGVSNQASDYNSSPSGYIKVQQLEQLMRQALSKLLAQNAAQQANLAQIQQEAQQYSSSSPGIAKTGLSYVVNPTILNRVNAGPYNPSQLISPQLNKPYAQKTSTSVTLQQSPGIYIPPIKTATDQSAPAEYGDYDSPDSVTNRSPSTAEPTRYPYSTYRPTQQTSLEDVNFGTKQKTKS